MAGGSVFYSIEITSRIDKTYRNGDSINANITKKSGEFPEGAYVTSGRLTFSDLRVFTRHEAGFNFGEWFSASETKVNEGGGFYAFEDVSVSDNIIDLFSDSVTVDIFGPDKLESGLYAFKTKSATLEVKYEIPSTEPDDGEEPDDEDESYDDDEWTEKEYSFTVSPTTNEENLTVISIDSLYTGKKFTLSHNFPKLTNGVWNCFVNLDTIEPYELYYKDSINTSWRLMEDGYIDFGKKLPSSITIKTSQKLLFECLINFGFTLMDEEEQDYYDSGDFSYWIGTETNKEKYWGFYLSGGNFGHNNKVIKRDVLLNGVKGFISTDEFSSEDILKANPILTIYASLESGTPLYLYNSKFVGYKNRDESLPISERFQEITKEGISLPTGENLVDLLQGEGDRACYFYTETAVENGDRLNIRIEGTVKGFYKVWGQNSLKVTDVTACKFPTSINCSCELVDEKGKYISDKFLVEWHGADGGIDNDIVAYEFYEGSTCIKRIETNLKDGRCYLSSPLQGYSFYYLKVVGSSGDPEFDAYDSIIDRITRASITPIKTPDQILLKNSLEDQLGYLIINNTLSGTNNSINRYQIQRKEIFNNGDEGSWLSIKEIPASSIIINDLLNYTGEYEFYRNERGEEVFKAKTDGILTIKEDSYFDIFAVGGGGSGNNSYHGGGGYTKTIYNRFLSKDTPYYVTIGNGGTQIDNYTGGNGSPTFISLADQTYIIKVNGGYGAYKTSEGYFNGKGGSSGEKTDGEGGQESTTRAFSDLCQPLYASGGGSGDPNAGTEDKGKAAANAIPNFGCGGSNHYDSNNDTLDGGNGGSGAVLIRKSNSIILPVEPPEDYDRKYLFRVRCVGEAGFDYASEWVDSDEYLFRDLNRKTPFTDDPIIPRETFVKAEHITELQTYIKKMSELQKEEYIFNFSTIIPEQTSLANWTQHINELRQAFDMLNSPHDEWKEIVINQPNAEILTQIRDILKQGKQLKVEFYNGDEKIHTQYVRYGSSVEYMGPIPSKKGIDFSYNFIGWSTSRNGVVQKGATNCITSETKLYACYQPITSIYEIIYKNEEEVLYTDMVKAYQNSEYLGEVPINNTVSDPENYVLNYWNPEPINVTENMICYPEFIHKNLTETIRDNWDEIIENINNNTYIDKYKIGSKKPLYLGEDLGWVNMILSGRSYEDTTNENEVASTTWISEQVLPIAINEQNESIFVNPWDTSKVREVLYNNIYPKIPENIKNNIIPIIKTIQNNKYEEKLWLPSLSEIKINGKYYNEQQLKKTLLDGTTVRWVTNDGYISTTIANGTIDSDNFPSNSTTYYYPILCFCIGTTDKYLE